MFFQELMQLLFAGWRMKLGDKLRRRGKQNLMFYFQLDKFIYKMYQLSTLPSYPLFWPVNFSCVLLKNWNHTNLHWKYGHYFSQFMLLKQESLWLCVLGVLKISIYFKLKPFSFLLSVEWQGREVVWENHLSENDLCWTKII